MLKPHVIVLAGPTASGKTACAVRLCQLVDGEVVSADSMQLYRGMDIGTAKPDDAEKQGIPHHLIDVAWPGEKWSAAAYREIAIPVLHDIIARGKQPVMCGGTGLYIDAVTKPMSFAAEGKNAVRREFEAIAELEADGRERLHAMLTEIDPETSERLHVNDVRRVIRALEVYRLTGCTMSEQARLDAAREGDFRVSMFTLNWPREELYRRIDVRVDQMMDRGLVAEVQALLSAGLSRNSTAMQALGYKEIASALKGETSMEQAVAAIKQGTRNYAKRQMTWFRRDTRTQWLEAFGRSVDDIAREMMKEIPKHDEHDAGNSR